jgi:hypothetical protein
MAGVQEMLVQVVREAGQKISKTDSTNWVQSQSQDQAGVGSGQIADQPATEVYLGNKHSPYYHTHILPYTAMTRDENT